MSKKIYLAGPMTNKPFFNFPAFHEATFILEAEGFEVFSPAKEDIRRAGYDFSVKCPTGNHDEYMALGLGDIINYRDCMRIDLNWILDHAEAIYLLPGWESSKGARCERALGECLGLEIVEL